MQTDHSLQPAVAMAAQPTTELFTIEDVATQLKVKPRTIIDWLARGILKGFKLGKFWRIHPDDLNTYINAHREA